MTISTIIIYFISIILSCLVFLKIYEKYAANKLVFSPQVIIKILIMSILYFINNLFMFNVVKTVISTFLAFIMFKWIFKEKTKTTLYYSLIITISLYLVEMILALFLPLGIKNIEVLNNSMIFKVGYSVAVNIMFYLITANKHIVKFFKELKATSKNNKLIYSSGILGLLICNFWLFYSGYNTSDKTLNLILCFTELLIFIFVIIVLKNKYEKNISEIKEEQLKQNLDLNSKIVIEYKELKHNLMNDFLIIKTKLPKKEQEFMNSIINKYQSNYDWVGNITDIPQGLQGLVFLKKNQAELKNITFNLEYNVEKNIEDLFKINNNFRLYETLGILFDNAIEGAEESKEKMINVVFSYNKNQLIISILNTFNNEIDVEEIGNKNYSTKNRGSGIGLNYLKRLKNKFEINQSIRGNIFITDIVINHKEKK